jgi:hypothetical protein
VCFTLYVPKVNDVIFHSVAPGRWAWVLGVGSAATFIALSEIYKLVVHQLLHHLVWLLRGGEAYEARREAKKAVRRRQRRRGLRRFARCRRERKAAAKEAQKEKEKAHQQLEEKRTSQLEDDLVLRTEADIF